MIRIKKGLTFDDILLEPQHSRIKSRSEVDISTQIGNINLRVPILSANMDSITEIPMAVAMAMEGGLGVLHRYKSYEQVHRWMRNLQPLKMFPSIGTKNEDLEAASLYIGSTDRICVDVAHGDSAAVVGTIKALVKMGFKDIMAGNIATGPAAIRLAEAGANIIKVGVGPGCFAGDTKVLMADGSYKNIKDIQVLDRVINMNGLPVTVVGTRYSGDRKVLAYKSNFWHKETLCTPDHNHWVGDLGTTADVDAIGKTRVLDLPTKTGESKYKWAEIGKVGDKSFLTLPKQIKFDTTQDFSVDMAQYALARRNMKQQVSYPILKPNYELGYLIGAFLGDGYAKIQTSTRNKTHKNTSGAMHYYFGSHESTIAERVQRFFEVQFGYKPVIKTSKNMLVVSVRSNPVIRFFERFYEDGVKVLPAALRCSNPDYCAGLLDGMIDSDGHVASDNRIGFTNTSEPLIELYMYLFYRVHGYFPSAMTKSMPGTHHFGDITKWKPSYSLRSVGRPEFNQTDRYQISTINKIDAVETIVPTFDIEVDCPTHSFIANNVIVHNSMCTTRIVTGHGVPQLTAIMDVAEDLKNYTIDRRFREPDYKVSIVADGGIRSSGDIVKALAAGADAVMIGSLLSGTDEAAMVDKYRGMASEDAQLAFRGAVGNGTAEGVAVAANRKGPVKDVLNKLCGGIRSGFSYGGATNIAELREKAVFIEITGNGLAESHPHGLTK